MLWTWISIMNPHRYTYGFAYSAPLAAITVLSTLTGLLFTKERESPFKNPTVTIFFPVHHLGHHLMADGT